MRLHRPVQHAAREAAGVMGGSSETHRHLRERLLALALTTVVVDIVCSLLAFLLERHEPGTEIHTFGSAVFWVSAQLLTVSSSMRNPLSVGGRVLDILMEVYAITVVGALAGSFGAFFHRRSAERASTGG